MSLENHLLDEDLFFFAANMSPASTGLPFVVWIFQNPGTEHDIQMMVSPTPVVDPDQMTTIALRPELRVISGSMTPEHLALLREWVELNFETLVGYWEYEIEDTLTALQALKPLSA